MSSVTLSTAELVGLIIGPAAAGWIAAGRSAAAAVNKSLNGARQEIRETRSDVAQIKDQVNDMRVGFARIESRQAGAETELVRIRSQGCSRLSAHLEVLAALRREQEGDDEDR